MKRVIGLLRVSTDAQDLARQRMDVQRVIASHGLQLIRTEEAGGVSGRHVQQDPQFQSIFKDLRRADVAGIAVSALDRLFRPDYYSDFAILDHFRANKKLIFSSKEGVLDPSSDAGFMMSLMSGAQAGMEWRELRRRTSQGKEVKRLEGKHPDNSRSLPRGIGYSKTTGWHYTEPDRTRILRAFDLLFAG
jgi:DNA invertase Pin-like site-specific DNA recombinase